MIQKPTEGNFQHIPSSLNPKKHSFAITDETGTSLIADVYRKRNWDGEKNTDDHLLTEANAKLLAAAPQMLKALRVFILRTNPGAIRNGKVSSYNTAYLDESIILAMEAIKAAQLTVPQCKCREQDFRCQDCINNIEVVE